MMILLRGFSLMSIENMRTVLRILSLISLVGMMGCDIQYGNVGEELLPQAQATKTEQAPPSPQPVASFVTFDSSKSEEELAWVELAPEVESQKLAPVEKSPSFEHYLTLDSKLYLSKAGELMADLTIGNENVVSVNRITVQCEEYDMNDSSVREASVMLDETLQVGDSVYWDQINFGYVHNNFETAQCKITNAEIS